MSVHIVNEVRFSREPLVFQIIEILSVALSHTPFDKALIFFLGHVLVP